MNASERRGALIVAIVAVLATAVGVYVKSCDRPLTGDEMDALYQIRETTLREDSGSSDTIDQDSRGKAGRKGKQNKKGKSSKGKNGSRGKKKGGKQPSGPAVDPFSPL